MPPMPLSVKPSGASPNGTRDTRDFLPGLTDRAIFIGQTGSGKTTLARKLLAWRRYVVVLDGKGTLEWAPEYVVLRSLDEIMARDPETTPRIVYRPAYDELADWDAMDRFFRWVYERRNTTLYVDELSSVTRGDQFPHYYGACLMRGRERGVEVWSATQRPTRIPQVAISESEHVYVFRLRLPQDRFRVEDVAGVSADEIAGLPKRFFLYARQDDSPRGPFTLRLSGS